MDDDLERQTEEAVDDATRSIIESMLSEKSREEIVEIVFRMREELVAANRQLEDLTRLLATMHGGDA
jgi:hypothetical protein